MSRILQNGGLFSWLDFPNAGLEVKERWPRFQNIESKAQLARDTRRKAWAALPVEARGWLSLCHFIQFRLTQLIQKSL